MKLYLVQLKRFVDNINTIVSRLNVTRDFGLHGRLHTLDINSIHLYRSCYIDPLKCGTWALAWDTTVLLLSYF